MAMQAQHISSTVKIEEMGPPQITLIHSHSVEDIGNLVGDSFSDMPSDDSGSWMNKVDVSNFKQLCAPIPATPASLLDHGGYAVTTTYPSPDSGESPHSPPSKKDRTDRTSFGSVDTPRDFSADPAPVTELPRVSVSSSVGLVTSGKGWPKPSFSYSCLIALSLKNSKSGRLTVAEIYNFMCENFPYFRSAPAGWKNSVRHNLSLNKCFEKIEVETPGGHGRKSCLWTMNPAKVVKMENEVRKCREKDPAGVLESLSVPEDMEMIEKGMKGMPGEGGSYYSTEGPTSTTQSHMLLLRAAPAGGSFASYPQLPQQGWTGAVSPVPPKTPPRQMPSPRIGHPGHFSTPTHSRRPQPIIPQQTSPFAQTPPYSPNVHSPHHIHIRAEPHPSSHWSSNTPQTGLLSLHSPYGNSSGFGSGSSGVDFGACSPCRMTPYDTAANALNNNSLLQSALAQSPCRAPIQNLLTLQSL